MSYHIAVIMAIIYKLGNFVGLYGALFLHLFTNYFGDT